MIHRNRCDHGGERKKHGVLLTQDAAAIVDKRVVGIINTVSWSRLKTIVKAAILEADPEGARAAAEAAARERGVFVGESDEHGTKTVWVKAAAGDVIRFDATVDDLARALPPRSRSSTRESDRGASIGSPAQSRIAAQ